MKRIGRAILDGETGFIVQPSGKEWYLDDERALAEVAHKVDEFRRGIEVRFNQLHANARRGIQRRLKETGQRYVADAARQFLDRDWLHGEMITKFAAATWRSLKMPGEAPIPQLLLNDAWRLLLDAEGISIFYRAVAHEQPRSVQRLDLIQLVYMGGVDRRMIVSADVPFLEAAAIILHGRYSNARAIHISELLA